MNKKIAIINGPNLNLLGKREPHIYGSENFEDFFTHLQSKFNGVELTYYQSNIEGELIDKLQELGFHYDGIVMNPASYSHTSIGIADAIAAIESPVIEVHISNIYAREHYRHQSLSAAACKGILSGFGLKGYEMAIQAFL